MSIVVDGRKDNVHVNALVIQKLLDVSTGGSKVVKRSLLQDLSVIPKANDHVGKREKVDCNRYHEVSGRSCFMVPCHFVTFMRGKQDRSASLPKQSTWPEDIGEDRSLDIRVQCTEEIVQ